MMDAGKEKNQSIIIKGLINDFMEQAKSNSIDRSLRRSVEQKVILIIMEKIPTNHGNMAINEVFDHLNYISYKTQRDLGVPHNTLKSLYVKSESFKTKYESDVQTQLDSDTSQDR